jgi:hypothetical protein
MISNLVSSILNPSATVVAADQAAAHRLDEGKNQPVPSTGYEAKPVATRLNRLSVHQSGAGERVDYFHASKQMLRDALSDFAGGVQLSFATIGLEEGMAEKITMAMMRQTKNALLWGVGFSVKLMTATVAQNSDAGDDGPKPTFGIMARSIEITVNHSDGIIDVSTGSVSIDSQFSGGPGTKQSHLLDIRDSDGQSTGGLSSALQALQDPQSLFDDTDGEVETIDFYTMPPSEDQDALEQTLPRIDTPRVLSRPEYSSRILLSEMNHFRNDRNELTTYVRLDALIPLSDKPVTTTAAAVASPPSPARVTYV